MYVTNLVFKNVGCMDTSEAILSKKQSLKFYNFDGEYVRCLKFVFCEVV